MVPSGVSRGDWRERGVQIKKHTLNGEENKKRLNFFVDK